MRVTQKFLTWARSVEPDLNAAVGEQWDDESMWVPLPGGGYAGYDAGPEAAEAIQHARACWDLFHAGDLTAAAAALRSAKAAIE